MPRVTPGRGRICGASRHWAAPRGGGTRLANPAGRHTVDGNNRVSRREDETSCTEGGDRAGGRSDLVTPGAHADEYPGSKPVSAVVPFSAGGPTDKVARELTMIMSKHLGTQIVIENLGGAGGTIGAKKVAQARNDGYTILIHHIGMSTAPALYRNLGFDPLKDFEMVGEIADVPMVMVGNKNLPPSNFKDLLPYIKANASKLSLANAGIGSASHLCGLLFQSAIQTELTTVPYKGTAPALTDIPGGRST